MPASLPTTLRTATPAEGLALARQLATRLHAELPAPTGMPGHLQPGAVRLSPEVIAAIYFNAIALANAGWDRPTGV